MGNNEHDPLSTVHEMVEQKTLGECPHQALQMLQQHASPAQQGGSTHTWIPYPVLQNMFG